MLLEKLVFEEIVGIYWYLSEISNNSFVVVGKVMDIDWVLKEII